MASEGIEPKKSPEEIVRAGDTIPRLSEAERNFLRSAIAQEVTTGFACPRCGHNCIAGELVCPNCNLQFSSTGKTQPIAAQADKPAIQGPWPVGEVFAEEQKAVYLEIGGTTVMLPNQMRIVIGRISDVADAPKPDVGLNEFNATDLGVSRQHLQITRSKDMVYVADLGSANGTYLNGRLLLPRINRILRNGDELRLGKLKLHMRF